MSVMAKFFSPNQEGATYLVKMYDNISGERKMNYEPHQTVDFLTFPNNQKVQQIQ